MSSIIEHLPFQNESFQTVVSLWAYPECWFEKWRLERRHHEQPLREIHRVLKPGGTALLGPALNEVYASQFAAVLGLINQESPLFDLRTVPEDGSRGPAYADHQLLILQKK